MDVAAMSRFLRCSIILSVYYGVPSPLGLESPTWHGTALPSCCYWPTRAEEERNCTSGKINIDGHASVKHVPVPQFRRLHMLGLTISSPRPSTQLHRVHVLYLLGRTVSVRHPES